MSINLLDMLKDQVSGQLAKQAGSFLGESESNVSSALGGAFPALLGSLISKTSEPSGAKGIMDMIGGVDTGMLSNIGSIFGGGASSVNGLLNSGGGIIESLLGDKLGGIVEMISKMSGMKSGSSSSLLKMAAPFLIGLIGKQVKGKGMSFLTDMLMGQKDAVAKAMPAGMGSLLGLGFANQANDAAKRVTAATSSATTSVRNTASATTAAATDAASSGMGWLKWALPILAIGALAYFMWPGAADKVDAAANATKDATSKAADGMKDAAAKTADATKDMANSAANAVSGAFANVDEAAKKALADVKFAAGSAGEQMMSFIDGGFKGDGKVTFNNLTFASGSAKMDASSAAEVDNLASILKAYPGVNVTVNGYTDNTGDAAKNKTLSAARAGAVQGRLIAQGIAANRISTNGYGAENPVASNDTDAGRAQNRRIEVTINK